MRDPFPLAPIRWLSAMVQPFADHCNLPALPLHIHEIVFAALFYTLIFWPISPWLSNFLVPQHYSKLSRKRRLNWDAHVVSFIQSTFINVIAIWVMIVDEDRKSMDWEARVWGYTGANAMIQALAAGYFVWDLFVTIFNLDVFGLGTLAHAVAALLVFSLGFAKQPVVNYYSTIFILWELSTPFLNIHWFMDKVNMTGTKAQLYNGIALLFSFFSCRLVYGTYQSFLVLRDILAAVNKHPTRIHANGAVMVFATHRSTIQPWIAFSYLVSNLTLNSLNFYWFVMMIRAVRKRFEPGAKAEPVTEVEVDLSSVATGAYNASHLQRRNI